MIVTDGLHRLYAWVHSERHLYPTKLSFTSLQVSKLTTSDDAKLLLSGTKPCRSWPIHVNAIAKRAIGQPHLCAEPPHFVSCPTRCPLSTHSLSHSTETRLEPHHIPTPSQIERACQASTRMTAVSNELRRLGEQQFQFQPCCLIAMLLLSLAQGWLALAPSGPPRLLREAPITRDGI